MLAGTSCPTTPPPPNSKPSRQETVSHSSPLAKVYNVLTNLVTQMALHYDARKVAAAQAVAAAQVVAAQSPPDPPPPVNLDLTPHEAVSARK